MYYGFYRLNQIQIQVKFAFLMDQNGEKSRFWPILAVLTVQKSKLTVILGPNALNCIDSLWNG